MAKYSSLQINRHNTKSIYLRAPFNAMRQNWE